jgi:DNA-binding transcriptional ArsR family regulator
MKAGAMQQVNLASTFSALGDPVRAAIVDRLADGDATVGELASLFPISFQAVSRHIGVLESAGVVARRREGKTRPVHLETSALAAPADWLESHCRRLEARYARLDALLAQPEPPKEMP